MVSLPFSVPEGLEGAKRRRRTSFISTSIIKDIKTLGTVDMPDSKEALQALIKDVKEK
jgi:hypothetical protein